MNSFQSISEIGHLYILLVPFYRLMSEGFFLSRRFMYIVLDAWIVGDLIQTIHPTMEIVNKYIVRGRIIMR